MEVDDLLEIEVHAVAVICRVLPFTQTLELLNTSSTITDGVVVGESGFREVAMLVGCRNAEQCRGRERRIDTGNDAACAKVPAAEGSLVSLVQVRIGIYIRKVIRTVRRGRIAIGLGFQRCPGQNVIRQLAGPVIRGNRGRVRTMIVERRGKAAWRMVVYLVE